MHPFKRSKNPSQVNLFGEKTRFNLWGTIFYRVNVNGDGKYYINTISMGSKFQWDPKSKKNDRCSSVSDFLMSDDAFTVVSTPWNDLSFAERGFHHISDNGG